MDFISKHSTTAGFENAQLSGIPHVALTDDDEKVHYIPEDRDIIKTIQPGKMGTFYYNKPIKCITPGVRLFTLTYIDSNNYSTTEETLTLVPAYTPIVIHNNGTSPTIVLRIIEKGVNIPVVHYDSKLHGTVGPKMFTANEMLENKMFILSGNNWILVLGAGELPATKCWIQIPIV